jgi:signal transduction histidine kinase
MKYLIIFLLIACQFFSYGQQTGIVKIDSLPPTGVLLDKEWKFQEGDNAEWAKPDFNDKSWQFVNPVLNITELPQLKSGAVIWLRLHIIFPNKQGQQFSIAIEQSGASQIFLNGTMIKEYGLLSTDKYLVKAFNPLNSPLLISPDSKTVQTLAIRYFFQPGINYRRMFNINYPLFRSVINIPDDAVVKFGAARPISLDSFKIGVCLMIFIFHFIFFLFYPLSRSNLYLSLWGIFNSIGYLYFVFEYTTNSVSERNFNALVALVFIGLASICLAFSIYLLLKQKSKFILGVILLLTAISFINTIYGVEPSREYIGFAAEILLPFLFLFMARSAVKQKINGAAYLLAGAGCYIIFWTFFNIGLIMNAPPIALDVFFHLAVFVFPISISLVLGLEFRFVNRTLSLKLREIEILSNEKQQILAVQNETLEKQVTERTSALNQSLENLKSTQSQLIQKEKMASLGELTAGIAHEIQNPLNFVNNFSEINTELIDELADEASKGNFEEIKIIANDIKENSLKINHHGKRADVIVKGMLQHSRQSSGTKESTDINALADEYLRLSYHGLRAKEKQFNASLDTSYDPLIGNINIIPQDIGRVLLNLFNNAFYAVAEKQKTAGDDYQPTVSISTKKTANKIELAVSDNGNGIPAAIKEKIFQPFFTTKPTGQGTGLGLSLSYDIVKAHGGEIKVETKEGEGTVFITQLPIS